jgi:hypothetical protein
MGGNGSYDKKLGGVPKKDRTHIETGYKVMGHKVLLQKGIEDQTKNILNANTSNSIYLIAKLNVDDTLTIFNVNINKGHWIGTEINLVFDSNGNIVPYNGKKTGSHSHKWIEQPDGNMGRKPVSNGENPHLPIPIEFSTLNSAIETFNKQKHKLKKK